MVRYMLEVPFDDKGPTMAAYYGLKLLKDLNIKLNKRIRIILGTDEESGWGGIEYYFLSINRCQ